MQPPIPSPDQIGTVDLASWAVVPGPSNQDKDEHGAWAVTAGDEEQYALYFEVADAAHPRQVAEFIVEAVRAHATRLRLNAAFDDILRERERLRTRPAGADLYELDRSRVVAMMAQLGKLAAEAYEPASASEQDAQTQRIYDEVTHLAALAVSWLEAIHARYGADGA
ncbi:hypothetical protein ACIBO5_45675 [Nonomuraea angiospora]|uniref:hypothetical protein n=1 Tax=Nonomuraea angiospora TaxID=46172 RepID=UPI0037AFE325